MENKHQVIIPALYPQHLDNESLNPLFDAIGDFIQGEESKRAYLESHAQLSTSLSRREQAKPMNASRARETREMLSLLSLVPKTTTTTKKSKNQPKQCNTMTPTNRSETKSGVVAYMANCVGGQLNLEMITPHQFKEFRSLKTQLDGHDDTTQHQSNLRRPPQDSKSFDKKRKMPWIERPLSTKTSSTSSNLRTHQESISGEKKPTMTNSNMTTLRNDLRKLLRVGSRLAVYYCPCSMIAVLEVATPPPSEDQRSPSYNRRSTRRSPLPEASLVLLRWRGKQQEQN